jgi:hypothetical protein
MSNTLVLLNDLYPNGIPVRIDWDRWEVGMSVFVPCTGRVRAGKQAREIAGRLGYKIVVYPAVEGGHLGVRIWRTA